MKNIRSLPDVNSPPHVITCISIGGGEGCGITCNKEGKLSSQYKNGNDGLAVLNQIRTNFHCCDRNTFIGLYKQYLQYVLAVFWMDHHFFFGSGSDLTFTFGS
jgi:hypothetical protein